VEIGYATSILWRHKSSIAYYPSLAASTELVLVRRSSDRDDLELGAGKESG